MNVLMVTSSYPKYAGDVTAPFIESIAQGLLARGHSVDVILPQHPELNRRPDEGIRFLTYDYAPAAGLNLWGYAQSLESDVRVRRVIYLLLPFVAFALRKEMSRTLKDTRYDVVHVHWVVPNAVLVADIVRAHGVPLVVSLHGSDVFLSERVRFVGALAASAFEAAGAITACSADLLERALALGAPPGRSRVVPYGVDVEAFAPSPQSPDLRRRLGIPEGHLLVFAFGRLVEKKGFSGLIKAVSGTPGVHLVLAGEGDLRQPLEAQAHALGVPVTFTGNLDRTSLARVLGAADVVVVPSVVDRAGNVDGLPNTLLEALAAGRPVVASRVAGIPEVIQDGVNGLLVPEGDPLALQRALEVLVGNPEARARLGREARRTAVERLGWEQAILAFEDCYAQAAALDAR
jgi:glycosyltransferase involved in cell wall biosynthesis